VKEQTEVVRLVSQVLAKLQRSCDRSFQDPEERKRAQQVGGDVT
jgi:hypothetical protein